MGGPDTDQVTELLRDESGFLNASGESLDTFLDSSV